MQIAHTPRAIVEHRLEGRLAAVEIAGDAGIRAVAREEERQRCRLGWRLAGQRPARRRTRQDVDRLIDWLRQRPFVHVDNSFALVHAGLHPRWTVADAKARSADLERELRGPAWRVFLSKITGGGKPPRWDDKLGGSDRWRAILAYLVRVRMCQPDGRVDPSYDGPPSGAPAGLVPWFKLPMPAWGTHTVVFGHWAALGLDIGPKHLGIDTGCVWGKSLTAVRLDDRSVFQVKAVEAPPKD